MRLYPIGATLLPLFRASLVLRAGTEESAREVNYCTLPIRGALI